MKKKRIGIFGGTFDPPHVGHLVIAERARTQLRLDRVLFIPAFVPPHKRKNSFAKPPQRLQMMRLAARGNPAFQVSDIEVQRKGVSYTVDTVKEIRRRYPDAELFLIIGADNYAEFKSWKSYREILQLARLVIYARSQKRNERPSQHLKSKVRSLQGELLDISSSEIRTAVRQKQSIRYLVPALVERYIASKKLYRR